MLIPYSCTNAAPSPQSQPPCPLCFGQIFWWLPARGRFPSSRDRPDRTAKQQDVRLWFVDCVMVPSSALHHTECPPLFVLHDPLWEMWNHLDGQVHVSVLESHIVIFLGIIKVRSRHDAVVVTGGWRVR